MDIFKSFTNFLILNNFLRPQQKLSLSVDKPSAQSKVTEIETVSNF